MLFKNSFKRLITTSPFEWGCVALFLFYIALCLTPSSYGMVLNIFGMSGDGLIWGNPRAIRSDEWAVWTPYFQSLVNNDFSRFNSISLYNEDYRGFSALPINDWALLFKPLLWPFLVFNDAYAFSAHHGLIMLTFIVGWKRLIDCLLPETKQYFISGIFSLLLFFSGFVQVWWTTLGPILALTPWLFVAVLWCEKITPLKALVFTYVAIAWLLSHTYPPIIISCAYVALLLVICFRRGLLNLKTIVGLALGSVIALATAYFYLTDAIQIMTQTVYPGKRVSQGGAVPWELWLSMFMPYINHSNYEPLFELNICELGVISSLLPMMAVIFVYYRSLTNADVKVIAVFAVVLVAMSLWMLLPIPSVIAKILLLDYIPGSRLVWAFGLALNLLALYILIKGRVVFNLIRLVVFSSILVGVYAASCHYYGLAFGRKSAWELLAPLILFGAYWYTKKRQTVDAQKAAVLLFTAATINFIYFGAFNPGQSAKPIFELKNSPALTVLKEKQDAHPKKWLVTAGYPGAVLQGLELNAVTHVLMMPKLKFFRELFPHMEEVEFNNVFNRYAHIHLSDEQTPYSPQADVILVPKKAFGFEEESIVKFLDVTPIDNKEKNGGGYIDRVEIDGKKITLAGWGMISDEDSYFFSNLPEKFSASLERSSRPDVSAALNNNKLANSGFILKFELPELVEIEKLCLYTKDAIFGIKQIMPGNPDMLYKCVNK